RNCGDSLLNLPNLWHGKYSAVLSQGTTQEAPSLSYGVVHEPAINDLESRAKRACLKIMASGRRALNFLHAWCIYSSIEIFSFSSQ
ncbi:MAG: hypothetical protein LBU32_30965, partial [Clostridiales bacterium]|nr:hypothetical protein [Clostridiales bacterium]